MNFENGIQKAGLNCSLMSRRSIGSVVNLD